MPRPTPSATPRTLRSLALGCALALVGCASVARAQLESPSPASAPGAAGFGDSPIEDRFGDSRSAAAPLARPRLITGQFANGLRYAVLPNRRPRRRVELRLVVDVGSLVEEDHERGIAHFVEHMAFNGTARHPGNRVLDVLGAWGARFGPDVNAHTGFAETVYRLDVPTDRPGALAEGVAILRGWAAELTFDSLEVERERGVVLGEWRSSLGTARRLDEQTLPAVYADSRHARRWPIGDTAVLRTATAARLRAFYRRWYRPHRMTVVAVGDCGAADVLALLERELGSLPPAETPSAAPTYPGPRAGALRVRVATDPEVATARVSTYRYAPPLQRQQPAGLRRELLAELLVELTRARLATRTLDASAGIAEASFEREELTRDVGSFTASALADGGDAQRALRSLEGELAAVGRGGFTRAELSWSRRAVGQRFADAAADPRGRSSERLAERLVEAYLAKSPPEAAPRRYARPRTLLRGISLAELNAYARVSLGTRPDVVTARGDTSLRALGWTPVRVARLLDGLAPTAAEPPIRERVAWQAPPQPQPATLIGRSLDTATGVLTLDFANGVRVLARRSMAEGPRVSLRALRHGGTATIPDEAFPAARMLNGVAAALGTGPYAPDELARALAGREVELGAEVSDDAEYLRGRCATRDLRTLGQLVQLQFGPQTFSPELAEAHLRAERSRAPAERASPTARLETALAEEIFGADAPRQRPVDWDAATVDDLARAHALYRQRYASACGWQFALVGDFAVDSLEAFAKTFLGTLPAGPQPEAATVAPAPTRSGRLERRVREGQAPRATALLLWAGLARDSSLRERVAFELFASALSLELADTLREDLGGVYDVLVDGHRWEDGTTEPAFAATVSFDAAPERVDTLLHAVELAVQRLAAGGPEVRFLDAARAQWWRAYREGYGGAHAWWLDRLEEAYRAGRSVRGWHPGRVRKVVRGIDRATLAAQAALLLDESAATRVRVVLGPADAQPELRGRSAGW